MFSEIRWTLPHVTKPFNQAIGGRTNMGWDAFRRHTYKNNASLAKLDRVEELAGRHTINDPRNIVVIRDAFERTVKLPIAPPPPRLLYSSTSSLPSSLPPDRDDVASIDRFELPPSTPTSACRSKITSTSVSWTCKDCTLINQPLHFECTACGAAQFSI